MKLKKWYRNLSITVKVVSVAIVGLLVFGVIGAAAQPGSTPAVTQASPATKTTKTQSPKVELKSASTTEPISFTSSTVTDSTLASGITQVRTAGADGTLTHTYQVTYTDGVETGRSAAIDTTTTPAINEVKVQGTYIAPAPVNCPNGTYVNSAGTTVCSPYASSSAPAGASAQCSDGTYSFSTSRRGTCSHHGGVATWL